ncbi:hypothetical protein ACP4OV_014827 [Aristida adscensionis]
MSASSQEDMLALQLAQLMRPALRLCAAHVTAGRLNHGNRYLNHIWCLAGVADGPLQRLAKIMANALMRHILFGAGINSAQLLPFLKVAYSAINRAILDAMENEQFVHVIDLSGPAAHPWQWLKLIQAFHSRRKGPPHLCITVVHDDESFLAGMSTLLRKKAESLAMAFSFHPVHGRLETLALGDLHATLGIRSGYARAFSCAMELHRLLAVDDAVAQPPPQLVASSCPPPAGTSTSSLHHPCPTTPLSPLAPTATPSPQRAPPPPPLASFLVEQALLAEEVRDVLVRDGAARRERRCQWAARMEGAGFGAVPLSYVAVREAEAALRECGLRGYENRVDGDGRLLLCRSGRPLYSVSAWRPWPAGEGSRSLFRLHRRQQMVELGQRQMASTWTWPQQRTPPNHNFTA